MAELKMLPIGIEDFEEIRNSNCYYIDKTQFIAELLSNKFTVNLITRPRRFGKTLTMNMLKCFFDIQKNSRTIFNGLKISENHELCREWMNQWPVIFLSFKDLAMRNFSSSYEQFAFNISNLCLEHSYLRDSQKVERSDQEYFKRLETRCASEAEVRNSLFALMRMLYSYYGKQVILLIDEYDVPLAKANEFNYYDEMLEFIRSVMSISLKTNPYLKFSVVTGCLRMAKESIFTGVNHFLNNSIIDGRYMDAFGFTDHEVMELLSETNLNEKFSSLKAWYDGYRFGRYEMYCPWDVVNYVSELMENPQKRPRNYWADTSHNNIIRKFIGNPYLAANEKFERLLSGECIEVSLVDNLTYDFDPSIEDNFWSILYLTGYLTIEDAYSELGYTRLKIPNEEIRSIFAETIAEWFKQTIQTQDRTNLFLAWWNNDTDKLTELISSILMETISYYDYREDFYHAFLARLFSGAGYSVVSNREMGLGRSDIVIKDPKNRRAIIIELKHSKSETLLEHDCQKALEQIQDMKYTDSIGIGYKTVICYGASFFQKTCLIESLPEKHL